jgi:hypothetical protein
VQKFTAVADPSLSQRRRGEDFDDPKPMSWIKCQKLKKD